MTRMEYGRGHQAHGSYTLLQLHPSPPPQMCASIIETVPLWSDTYTMKLCTHIVSPSLFASNVHTHTTGLTMQLVNPVVCV